MVSIPSALLKGISAGTTARLRIAIFISLALAFALPAPAQSPDSERIAFRYDATHVIVQLDQAGNEEFRGVPFTRLLRQLPLPDTHASGISVVGTSDELMSNYMRLFGATQPGQAWAIQGNSRSLHATAETLAFSGTGCQTEINAVAILAIAPAEQQEFRAAGDFFLVHPGETSPPAGTPALLGPAHLSAAQQSRLKIVLNNALQYELRKVKQASQGEYQRDKALAAKWTAADDRLARGQGKLAFEAQQLRLGPDGQERLYVRAKWSLGDYAAFLVSAWVNPQGMKLEAVDAHAAQWIRTREYQGKGADIDSLPEILGVFPGEGGWGRVLVGHRGQEGYWMDVSQYSAEGPKETEISYGYGC